MPRQRVVYRTTPQDVAIGATLFIVAAPIDGPNLGFEWLVETAVINMIGIPGNTPDTANPPNFIGLVAIQGGSFITPIGGIFASHAVGDVVPIWQPLWLDGDNQEVLGLSVRWQNTTGVDQPNVSVSFSAQVLQQAKR